jgi:hypothetical protein
VQIVDIGLSPKDFSSLVGYVFFVSGLANMQPSVT